MEQHIKKHVTNLQVINTNFTFIQSNQRTTLIKCIPYMGLAGWRPVERILKEQNPNPDSQTHQAMAELFCARMTWIEVYVSEWVTLQNFDVSCMLCSRTLQIDGGWRHLHGQRIAERAGNSTHESGPRNCGRISFLRINLSRSGDGEAVHVLMIRISMKECNKACPTKLA